MNKNFYPGCELLIEKQDEDIKEQSNHIEKKYKKELKTSKKQAEVKQELVNNLNNFIYIFFFISIWLCLDTYFDNVLSFKEDNNVKNFFLSLRAIFPLIFFFLFFILF